MIEKKILAAVSKNLSRRNQVEIGIVGYDAA